VPVYLMASFATEETLRASIAGRSRAASPAEVFAQAILMRLTLDGAPFRDAAEQPSLFAPGHGDLPSSLARAGILKRFVDGGGRVLFMSNVDNLGATLDPALIALHLRGGAAITVEVAPKAPGDAGGIPARVDGMPQVVEAFRLPTHFDDASVDTFNTNTFFFDARALRPDVPLTWFLVEKKVDGRPAVQIERLVGEATAFLPTRFVKIEREGSHGRFFPVKEPADLEHARGPLREALIARGVLDA
jgi:UTP--glucose-1-phosphate uridylyltransferase